MDSNETILTGTYAWWNAVSAATSEAVVQAVEYGAEKAFLSPAANIAAFHDFLSNVAQAIIEYNRDQNPDSLEKIENQAAQILIQMGLMATVGSLGKTAITLDRNRK